MREYRGKSVDTGEWVYGYYTKKIVGNFDMVTYRETLNDFIITSFSSGGIAHVEVDPKTVGQYLNLTDRNGKDVCEDDMFGGIMLEGCYIGWCDKCKSIQVLVFETDKCMACVGDLHWHEFVAMIKKGEVEVNGNIHDNPELMEER